MLFKGILETRESRTWGGDSFPFMYNPTIHWLSEDMRNYGSFYCSSGDAGPMWNCFDQALVSPSLMNGIRSYSYLKTIGEINLIASVGPKRAISDHLPLLVDLDMRQGNDGPCK